MRELPEGLVTPVLVVDVDVLDRNIARMAQAAGSGGFALRPHAKSHKCAEIAERQLRLGARGLSVATLSEAEALARAGVDDLFIAYPLWLDRAKAGRARTLADEVALRVGVDSVEGARRLGDAVRGSDRPVQALVEVDCGTRRTGVPPADAGRIAGAAVDAGLDVLGVFTFPGHGYGHDADAAERAARDEECSLAEAAASLGELGLGARVLSGGSTPTAGHWQPGPVNELRPGVYVFNDAQQLAIGTCTAADLALSAASTVISVPAPNRFVLDAGSKVLGPDRSPWVTGHGYLPAYPDATITALWEHHAVVQLPEGVRGPRLGEVVSVVPNHVCTPVNLADELLIAREGVEVDRWKVAARGTNS
ncbi:alanine racemase [Streptomyces sp. NBC_00038]|uniref:alanine racemase n=1 Tax=Streptomyces sp. NBC_00038 TaxID=2903615 RepID=UPI002251BE01|nr:alanine racemase [Streptomyces sp. NBC_00038]MCX5561647.1 alanine racemase [Streptomyces sp. NBC_00038]